MDIQAYIASGILELYALDQLSPPERAEVEGYVLQYPELQAELGEIERSLEFFAQAQATAPPAELMQAINQQIDRLEGPAMVTATPASGGNNWSKWVAGIALAGLIAMVYFYFQGQQRQQDELAQLQESLEDCEERSAALGSLQQQIALVADPDSRYIELAGTADHLDAQAAVVYNPDKQASLFAPSGLPAIPADRQYQLWAIVDGATISLGVFDAPVDGDQVLLNLPFEANVDAFAITLEPRGGSINPTLAEMYVIGQAG
ncbi:MAG: anti-sigma factor [Bacteroidota bacterium]